MTTFEYIGVVAVFVALGSTGWLGVRQRDAAVVGNAIASIGVTALPLLLEALAPLVAGTTVPLGPALPLCIGVAALLHMFGMLGWYDELWWWDHLTHAVSAALVTAVVYAWLLVTGVEVLPLPLSALSAPGAAFTITVAAGVIWELIEVASRRISDYLGFERVLKHYGPLDTPFDLVFDVVGAFVVIGFDVRLFVSAFEPIPGVTRTMLETTIGVLAALAVASIAIVAVASRWE